MIAEKGAGVMNAERNTSNTKLDRVEKRARELMQKYHNCSQCSAVAIMEVYGIKNDELAKAASGFASGMGIASVCGGLVGAALALSTKYGRDVSIFSGAEEEAMAKSRIATENTGRLAKWFEREFGNLNCRDLRKAQLGIELNGSIAWQNEIMKELGMNTRCQEIVGKTARRAAAMLDNPALGITEKA